MLHASLFYGPMHISPSCRSVSVLLPIAVRATYLSNSAGDVRGDFKALVSCMKLSSFLHQCGQPNSSTQRENAQVLLGKERSSERGSEGRHLQTGVHMANQAGSKSYLQSLLDIVVLPVHTYHNGTPRTVHVCQMRACMACQPYMNP